jgi:pimeloyl-ACP methyl ester carboxylesterase
MTDLAPLTYVWNGHRCAYDYLAETEADGRTPLLLIHPIGVGLSRHFWGRFCQQWRAAGYGQAIYNPDLLGCGDSDMPRQPYTPADWANQLGYFLQTVVQQPVVILVQGALLPVALELLKSPEHRQQVRGLVMAGPPPWDLINQDWPRWKTQLFWRLFNSPLGGLFFRYARRRQFLQRFSVRQLFDQPEAVDEEWLEMLNTGAPMASRHAVFSFLAGFWRQDYRDAIAALTQPSLVVMGEATTSISRSTEDQTGAGQRLIDYRQHFPDCQGITIPGRNVLPYESVEEFVDAIAPFIQQASHSASQF